MAYKHLLRNLSLSCLAAAGLITPPAASQTFKWPEGKKMAISLTFDDARGSQATAGVPLLNEYGIKGTFYLVPSAVQKQLEGWKKAVASGHEMGTIHYTTLAVAILYGPGKRRSKPTPSTKCVPN